MKKMTLALAIVAATFATSTIATPAKTKEVKPPVDRVVVMYFHRTNRCPTCVKMGGYSEESVSGGFAAQVKAKKVSHYNIDFQDQKNAGYTRAYQVAGPSLIVARVKGNKVAEWTNLDEMWGKAGDKDAFLKYVRTQVQAYLDKNGNDS